MSILYAGGLWTIFLIVGVSMGYNWALNGPRWGYRALLALGIVAIAISQLLPESHLFHIRVAEGLDWWLWATAIGIPVLLYARAVRWLRRKAEAKNDS